MAFAGAVAGIRGCVCARLEVAVLRAASAIAAGSSQLLIGRLR